MSKPNSLFDTKASIDRFLDLLEKRQFDAAFQLVFRHAKTTGDESITHLFAHTYRDFMAELTERHVDLILDKAKQGVEAYRVTQKNLRLAETSNKPPTVRVAGKITSTSGHINSNGVILRRTKA